METQKEIWNIVAKKWMEYRKQPRSSVENFLKDKHGKILDLGCGSGRHFKDIKGEIYGVDFSKNMISYARKTCRELKKDAKLFCEDASKLPFDNDFFDSAIYIATLTCIESEKKRKNSLNELYRVLKKGSRALISVWSRNHDRIKKGIKEQLIPWTVDGKKYLRFYYIYDSEEILDLLSIIGFKIIVSKEDENITIEVEK